MKRRIWAAAMAFVLTLSLIPETALAGWHLDSDIAYPVTGGNLYIRPSSGEIVDCDWTVTRADIPASVGSVAVTQISYSAFLNCIDLTSVSIPSGITSIDGSMFGQCTKLREIRVEQSNPRYSSENGCLFNKNGTELVIVPGGREGTFIVPDNVASIERGAFNACGKLTDISIPSATVSISSDFSNCSSLKTFSVASDNPAFSSMDGVLFNKDKSILINYPCGKDGEYVVPSSVNSIADYAFLSCDNLTKLTIPDTVTELNKRPVGNCGNLKEVVLFCVVEYIDGFSSCPNLTSFTIPEGVKTIGAYAFSYCAGLEKVSIPLSLERIEYDAFEFCENIMDIYYAGSKEQWDAIDMSDRTAQIFQNAKLHTNQAAPDPTTGKVKVSNIKINAPQGTTVRAGESIQLTATVYPANATDKTVYWLYTDPNNIVSVDKNGKVTGLKAGKTAVGVLSCTGKLCDTIEITVVTKGLKDYSDYKYNFSNHASSFGYWKGIDVAWWNFGGYAIPKERYLQAGFSESEAESLIETWGGNCFGMSSSSVLFYTDYLKEEHYDSTVHRPIGFNAPKTEDYREKKLREMIELLQVSQFALSQPILSCHEIVSELDKGNPVTLGLTSNKGGHRVVIYDYSKSPNGNYVFAIYDCSSFVESVTYVNDNYWSFSYLDNSIEWQPYSYCTVDMLASKCDDIRNKNKNHAISLFAADTRTWLFTPASDLTITNKANQTTSITDDTLNGSVENINLTLRNYLAETPSYIITAPADEYTITGVNTLSMANDELSVDIEASGPITVSADLKTVTAGAGDFTVTYTTYGEDYDTMTLTGTASGEVTCVLGDNQATVTGADTLTASATVSEETVNMTETDTGGGKLATFGAAIPDREKTPAPEYDLNSGTYEAGQTLTFTKDDDTIVYYSIDGGEEAIYSLPLTIDRSMTITAHAEKYGYDDSDTVTLTYTLPEVEAPEPSVEAGTYQTAQYVDLFNGDYEADVYYTTDGEDPKEDGLLFGSSIILTEDTTVKAYAVKDGCASEVVTLKYDITLSDDFMLINAPSDQNGEVITADTLDNLTAVRLVVRKFGEGAKTGRFAVAFYDRDGRYLGMGSQQAEITKETDKITVPINGCFAEAAHMKVLLLDEAYRPVGGSEELDIH